MLQKVDRKYTKRDNLRRSRSHSPGRIVRKCVGAAYVREADSFIDPRRPRNDAAVLRSNYSNRGFRAGRRTLDGSEEMTQSMSEESGSCLSGKSEWTDATSETKGTRSSASTWLSSTNPYEQQHQEQQLQRQLQRQLQLQQQRRLQQQQRLKQQQQLQQQQYLHKHEDNPRKVVSPTDSVGAVRVTKGGQSVKSRGATNNSTFDYIRRVHRQFSQPYKDPPSDKSMATAHSIRAEDTESDFFKKGVLHRRQQNELTRQILKRKQLALIQAGYEP